MSGLRDALSGLPDEAQVPVGWIREKLDDLPMKPKLLTTSQASELWSYSPEWWAREAKEGRIEGAFQDGEGGLWRLPYASCEARIEAKRDDSDPSPRRRREPWGPAPTPTRRSGSEDLQARELEVLAGGSEAVGRRPEDDAGPDRSGVAGEGRANRGRGDR